MDYREHSMKKIRLKNYLYPVILLLLCLFPSVGMLWHPTTEAIGNSTGAAKPVLRTSEGWNIEYLTELQNYLEDHFAYRPELISAQAHLQGSVFGTSAADGVIYGQNNVLYYEATLDDYQKKNLSSDRQLFNMAHNVYLMQEYTQLLGKNFIFTIAPNKNSLYADNMPERLQVQVGEKSDAERLLPYLEAEGVRYVDLFALFRAQKENLYYLRDSHWNNKGALLVYNTLMDAAGIDHERYDAVIPEQMEYSGDLNEMLYPVWGNTETDYRFLKEPSYEILQEDATVESDFVSTFNPSGSGNLLMYRDSFGNTLIPYFAEHYASAVFSKRVPYTMTDLVTYAPDTVIVEKVERHIQTLGSVPPQMSAPERFLAEETGYADVSAEPVCQEEAVVKWEKDGIYLKLRGGIPEGILKENGKIYAEFTDATGESHLYEAFDINFNAGITTDYGFLLYYPLLDSDGSLKPEHFQVRVLGETPDGLRVMWRGEIREEGQ